MSIFFTAILYRNIHISARFVGNSSYLKPKQKKTKFLTHFFLEIFDSPRSSQSEHLRRMMPSAISSGADISADGEGYDNDCDVTENKRRKSKIELDR